MVTPKQPRLIMIGLDGATFAVIRPLVEQGRLPNLARMMSQGAHGTLNSIVPPITGPAWSVLSTGRNPGQLGAFDFINRRTVDDYRLYPIRSDALAGHTFWDVMNHAGLTTGVLNWPMMLPAYEVDGWLIAGLGASRLHDYAYPPELKAELDRVVGEYDINISYGLPKYADNLPLLIQDMHDMLDMRMAALEHLLKTRPVDVVVAVILVSDVAQHTLWEFWDVEDETALTPRQREMREAFIKLWEDLDAAVGRIESHLAPGGHTVIVSDHGFGPSHGVFHINRWLEEEGYLVRKTEGPTAGNRLREWIVKATTPFLGPLYKRLIGSQAQQLLRASILREIDLENTKAFALENSDGYGGIFVNRRYAKAYGLDVEGFLQSTSENIKQDLIAWGNANGVPMQAFLSTDLYSGAKADLAPEVLLLVDDLKCSVSYRMQDPIFDPRPHHPMKSGSHRMNGVLFASGPRIAPGQQAEGAQLQDIAPTLLSLVDVPAPAGLDGRVLSEMFRPEFQQAAAELAAQTSHSEPGVPTPTPEYEDEDMEIVLQRLKDLGYID